MTSSGAPTGWGVVIAVLGIVVGSGALGIWIKGMFDRKSVGANAQSVLNAAAVQMLAPLQGELARVTTKLEAAENLLDMLQRREREWLQQISDHTAWDYTMISDLRQLGGNPPPVPTLHPPARHDRTRRSDRDHGLTAPPPVLPDYGRRETD